MLGRRCCVATAALLLTCGACYRGNPAGQRVAIVGDSVTRLAREEIDEALVDEFRVDIQVRDGKRIDEMLPVLHHQLSGPTGPPEVVIVNLGTNDAVQGYDGWPAGFDEVVAATQSVTCVLLVTIAESTNAYGKDGTAAAINDRIRATASEHANVHVVDWNEVVATRGLEVSLEGIHPTPLGEQIIADLYRSGIEAGCGGATE